MTAEREAILVVDGACGLCSRGAQLVARLDEKRVFRICPTQSPRGRALMIGHGLDPEDPDSWLYLEDGAAHVALDGIIRMGWRLGGVGLLLQPLRLLPRPARDALYRLVARHRYRLFGRGDLCAMPDPALQDRLIR